MTQSIALADQHCSGYKVDEQALDSDAIAELLPQIDSWQVLEEGGGQRLQRVFTFPNFVQALAFTNAVGAMAEAEDHHPTLTTAWGKVTVTWWTHFVGGLHRNDFIAAAKTDRIYDVRSDA